MTIQNVDQIAKMPRQETLTDQLNKVQDINVALRQRVARDSMRLLHEHDRRYMAVQQDYDQRMRDAINKLEDARNRELRQINEEYHEAKREIDRIAASLD